MLLINQNNASSLAKTFRAKDDVAFLNQFKRSFVA